MSDGFWLLWICDIVRDMPSICPCKTEDARLLLDGGIALATPALPDGLFELDACGEVVVVGRDGCAGAVERPFFAEGGPPDLSSSLAFPRDEEDSFRVPPR